MIFPVPSQRSHGLSVGLPVALSSCLPVPLHSGQTSSPVPGVPTSGSSSGVWCRDGFLDCMVCAPFCIQGLAEENLCLLASFSEDFRRLRRQGCAPCQGSVTYLIIAALIPSPRTADDV